MAIQAIVNNSNIAQSNQVNQNSIVKNIQEDNPIVKSYENSYMKMDSFFGAAVSSANKSYEQFLDFTKKLMFNQQFREVAIDSNAELKQAYSEFMSAIEGDSSKLAQEIKNMLGDSSKFSGEFFVLLNNLASSTESQAVKDGIYNLLKAFDNYFSQNQNGFAVNSSFENIMSQLPKEVQNRLADLMSQNSSNNLSNMLFSIFDSRLPNEEKSKLALSFMSDIINDYGTLKEELPINILLPNNLSKETQKFISNIAKSLKDANLELPKEIEKLLNNLPTEGGSRILTTNQSKVVNEMIKLMSVNTVPNGDLNKNIDEVIRNLVNLRNLPTTALDVKEQINEIINLLNNVKALEGKVLVNIELVKEGYSNSLLQEDSEVILNGKNNDNILKLQLPLVVDGNGKTSLTGAEIKQLIEIMKLVSNGDVLNVGALIGEKDQMLSLFSNIMDNLLGKIIYGDVDKNKNEILMNFYEKQVMPEVLKNNNLIDKNAASIFGHNLLRLKLGTAGEFNKNFDNLMQLLSKDGIVNNQGKLELQMNLADKLLEMQKNLLGSTSLLNLLNLGIRNAANESVKGMFENALFGMMPRNDFGLDIKNYFIPLFINGENVMSHISIKKKKEENGKVNSENEKDDYYEITLILEVERKGEISAQINYYNGEVSAHVILPDTIKFEDSDITEDIFSIIDNNKLVPKNIQVSKK